MLALAVVAALPAVGALLVSSLLVVPSATARLLNVISPDIQMGTDARQVAKLP